MSEAPEEKWLAHNGGLPSGNYPKSDMVRYVRADVHEAAVAAARAEALSEVARDLRYRASEPGRTGPSIRALVAAAMAIESLAREEASK